MRTMGWWREWPDRVFYTLEDGKVQSLSQIWGNRPPIAIATFSNCLRLAGREPLRQLLRNAVWRAAQVALER